MQPTYSVNHPLGDTCGDGYGGSLRQTELPQMLGFGGIRSEC